MFLLQVFLMELFFLKMVLRKSFALVEKLIIVFFLEKILQR